MSRRKDRFSRAQRSVIMSKIRSKDTRLELAMRKLLRKAGIGFRAHPKMYGNPDFIVDENIAVFCDSSFWHGRDWRRLKGQLERGSNPSYWVTHIARNRRRDRQVNAVLRRSGYKLLRFWDDDILGQPERCLDKIRALVCST